MKANEIRIGNHFWHKGKEWSYRNDEASINGFEFQWNESDWYALGECTLFLENIEPIPLTEEWLLKFGFELLCEKAQGFLATVYSKNNGLIALTKTSKGFKTNFSLIELEHTHQLQNLYFSLTGKELEVK